MGAVLGAPAFAQPVFSGVDRFPLESHEATDQGNADFMAEILYGGRTLIMPKTECTPAKPCPVTVKAVRRWVDDSQTEHLSMVAAAEVPDGSHASGALIGAADLAHTIAGWKLNAGSPMVAESGEFGQAPLSAMFSAGRLGMAFVLMPSSMGQGYIVQRWKLYLISAKTHQFELALDLSMTADSTGACEKEDRACLKGDFTTHFKIISIADGIAVEVTKSEIDGPTTHRTYQCANPMRFGCQ